MRKTDLNHYGEIARLVSCRSTMRHKIGCVLVDTKERRHVVAYNRWLGDPEGKGWSLHAEVWAALRAEEYGIRPTVALITRANNRLARPCPRCHEVLEDLGVRTVWFTTDQGVWVSEEIA